MKKRTEHTIQTRIIEYLRIKGYRVFRTNSGTVQLKNGRFFNGLPRGFSDLLIILPGGKAVFVEVKTPQGKPTRHQVEFLQDMRELGAHAGIATSEEEAEQIIKGETVNEHKEEKFQGFKKKLEEDWFNDKVEKHWKNQN